MDFREWYKQDLILEKITGVVDFWTVIKYSAKFLNCRIVDTKKGLQVCPPLEYSPVCYSMHTPHGPSYETAPKHLIRFLANAYKVSPTELTNAIIRQQHLFPVAA